MSVERPWERFLCFIVATVSSGLLVGAAAGYPSGQAAGSVATSGRLVATDRCACVMSSGCLAADRHHAMSETRETRHV